MRAPQIASIAGKNRCIFTKRIIGGFYNHTSLPLIHLWCFVVFFLSMRVVSWQFVDIMSNAPVFHFPMPFCAFIQSYTVLKLALGIEIKKRNNRQRMHEFPWYICIFFNLSFVLHVRLRECRWKELWDLLRYVAILFYFDHSAPPFTVKLYLDLQTRGI